MSQLNKIPKINNMKSTKIYLVSSFGGQYEDSWEHNECAFTNKEDAQTYVNERNALAKQIDDELYEQISNFINSREDELWSTYYDEETFELKPGKSEEEYNRINDDFTKNGRYTLIKLRFNIDKETWDIVEHHHDWDFCDYNIEEIDLYNGRKD